MEYDTTKYYLGSLCKRDHKYFGYNLSLRIKKKHHCRQCQNEELCRYRSKNKRGRKQTIVECMYCFKQFGKNNDQVKRSSKHFCSLSCSAKHNIAHKTYGTKVSKLERWLQNELCRLYPNLEFHFNRRDTISSELDIYIPSLRLAFELNGPFHYEPIFGEEKLKQTQNNDHRKFGACQDAKISLCVIDTSKMVYCVPKNFMPITDIVVRIINENINALPQS